MKASVVLLTLLIMTSISKANSLRLDCRDVSGTVQIEIARDEAYQPTAHPGLEKIVMSASNDKSKKISFIPESDFERRIEQNAVIIPFVSAVPSKAHGYTDLLAVARYDSSSNLFVGAISQGGHIFPLSCIVSEK